MLSPERKDVFADDANGNQVGTRSYADIMIQ